VAGDGAVTENEQKQQFSIAYIHAVAARAGYACQANLVDDDSVDITLAASGWVHGKAVLRSPRLEVQLKATAQEILRADHLAFPLPLKNYNDLRECSMVPRLLVVLFLPPSLSEWLEQTEDQMVSRRCAYWLSLFDQPEVVNAKTVTVQVPRKNCLTVDNLQTLMQHASRRQPL
jgi:hypothetical protein